MSKRDYYEVLGISKSADTVEIKKAYRTLAVKFHPDRNPGDKASEENFKEASEAYEVLSNPQKRQAYDRFGHAGVDASAGGGFSGFEGFSGGGGSFNDIFGDIFGDLFGGGGQRQRRSSALRGEDLRLDLELEFEEAAFGESKTLSIPKLVVCGDCKGSGAKPGTSATHCPDCQGAGEIRFQQGFFTVAKTCPRCSGAGEVIQSPCTTCSGRGRKRKDIEFELKVPAGVNSGHRLKLAGQGNPGVRNGPAGDLYVIIHVKAHDYFTRENETVHCDVPIRFAQAALGDEIEVPTLDGSVKLKIPAGAQPGKQMRLKSKGIPRLNGLGRGDQIVKLVLNVPTKLSADQKELLKEFDAVERRHSKKSNIFEKVKDVFD